MTKWEFVRHVEAFRIRLNQLSELLDSIGPSLKTLQKEIEADHSPPPDINLPDKDKPLVHFVPSLAGMSCRSTTQCDLPITLLGLKYTRDWAYVTCQLCTAEKVPSIRWFASPDHAEEAAKEPLVHFMPSFGPDAGVYDGVEKVLCWSLVTNCWSSVTCPECLRRKPEITGLHAKPTGIPCEFGPAELKAVRGEKPSPAHVPTGAEK